jgi:hypothetical protein
MADDVIRETPSRYPAPVRAGERFNFNKVSWGAIWAGVMVTIGMEALFLSFGIFIGALFGGSAAWTMAWYLVTMAVSFYAGGWTAARLSDVPVREVSVLHGVTTWGLATLATAILGIVVTWAALWVGTTTLVTGAVRPFTWGATAQYGGVIWGGIILSLVTAYFGASSGVPGSRSGLAEPEAPPAPIRRAG